MNEPIVGEPMVPAWAVTMVAQVSEIKARTEAIPQIQRELEGLRAAAVPLGEHKALEAKVDQLWDAHNAREGELRARSRADAVWRAGFAVAYGVLALWVAAHQAAINLHF